MAFNSPNTMWLPGQGLPTVRGESQSQSEAAKTETAASFGHVVLGKSFFLQGRHREAEAEFREAIRLKPDNAEAHFNLGYLLRKRLFDREKLIEAVRELKEALRLNPGHDQARWCLTEVLFNLGEYAEAVPAFRESLLRNPKRDLHFTRWQIGYALLRQGKYREAEKELRLSLRKDGTFDRTRFDLSEGLWKQGKCAEAAKVLLGPPRMDRGNPEFHYRLGRCYAQWGKEREALKCLRSAIETWDRQMVAVLNKKPSDKKTFAPVGFESGTLERFMLYLSPDLKTDLEWDDLRKDQRFKRLAAKAGMVWTNRRKALKVLKMKGGLEDVNHPWGDGDRTGGRDGRKRRPATKSKVGACPPIGVRFREKEKAKALPREGGHRRASAKRKER